MYQEALAIEFELQGIPFEREKRLDIKYKGRVLEKGYVADFVCYGKIVLEIKATQQLVTENTSQVLNYLNATAYRLGLLVNFGESSLRSKRILL